MKYAMSQRKTLSLERLWKNVQKKWTAPPVQGELFDLYNRQKALPITDSCLMFKERVVIPPSLRRRVLKQFHSNHPRTNRMKAIARGYAYWPGMDKDIEGIVKDCLKCQSTTKGPPRENPIPWKETKKQWSRAHVDFAGPINGVTYLVLVDSHSKWSEVITMSSTSVSAQKPTEAWTCGEFNCSIDAMEPPAGHI